MRWELLEAIERGWARALCRCFGHAKPERHLTADICSRCSVVLRDRSVWRVPVKREDKDVN